MEDDKHCVRLIALFDDGLAGVSVSPNQAQHLHHANTTIPAEMVVHENTEFLEADREWKTGRRELMWQTEDLRDTQAPIRILRILHWMHLLPPPFRRVGIGRPSNA